MLFRELKLPISALQDQMSYNQLFFAKKFTGPTPRIAHPDFVNSAEQGMVDCGRL